MAVGPYCTGGILAVNGVWHGGSDSTMVWAGLANRWTRE